MFTAAAIVKSNSICSLLCQTTPPILFVFSVISCDEKKPDDGRIYHIEAYRFGFFNVFSRLQMLVKSTSHFKVFQSNKLVLFFLCYLQYRLESFVVSQLKALVLLYSQSWNLLLRGVYHIAFIYFHFCYLQQPPISGSLH